MFELENAMKIITFLIAVCGMTYTYFRGRDTGFQLGLQMGEKTERERQKYLKIKQHRTDMEEESYADTKTASKSV